MEVDCIPYRKTGYFSGLISDYLDQLPSLQPFYNRFPELNAFEQQIKEKAKQYPIAHRKVLFEALTEQYGELAISEATDDNLRLLKSDTTFTVVTGHQLNLFTGPLYFLYKIVTALNLADSLKKRYPDHDFVPVYWMATEDHDFEEINYFNFRGKKLQWNRGAGGAVGRMETQGLEAVLSAFVRELGPGERAKNLADLFRKAYLEHDTLAAATRFLANALFGAYGLVVVDGDDSRLKRIMAPYVEQDIFQGVTHAHVSQTIKAIREQDTPYPIQVNPRKINYFYLQDGIRERIEEREGHYHVLNTDLNFSKAALEQELREHPQRFSPNVITRPVYQEVILPNLCYIGGGGELAYWMQLKGAFDALEVPFPMLLLRNSALLLSNKQRDKLVRLGIRMEDLFLKQSSFINKRIRQISNIDIDFSEQKKALEEQFRFLYQLAGQTDKSFLGAVRAQEVRQKKGLDKLEKRLLKAQKRKLRDEVLRMTSLQDALFPGQSLQERQLNFSEMYLEMGEELLPGLLEKLQPLDLRFAVLTY